MPFKEEVPDLTKWINSRVESLDRDFSISPAERAVKYYRYHGQPFQFRGFEWQIQILNDMHPRQVIQKRSQVGLTTIMMLKVILFLEQYSFMPHWFMSDEGAEMSIFPTAIYTLENDDKVREFSADWIKEKRVWMNHSAKVNIDDPRLGFNWIENDIEPNQEEIFLGRISEDTTGALDAYFDFLYQGCLETPAHEDNIQTIISHHTAMRKTTTEKKLTFGRVKYETIYYSTGASHFCHSGKFVYQAVCLFFKLPFFNPKIILASRNIDGVKLFQRKN